MPFAIARQTGHVLSGDGDGPGVPAQFSAFARMRAIDVFPVPRGPGEEVGLPHLVVLDRVLQRPDDRLLPDDLVEALRAVLPVERGHSADSIS